MFPLQGKRIVIAKPGLDGHDAGAKVITLTLRDAGADVIYTGLRKTPDYIARVAVEEDADALGLSILSGSHLALVAATMDALRRQGGEDIKVFVGGTIPEHDHAALRELGVAEIYTSDMPLAHIVSSLAGHLAS
ncbi:MAG TPA: cobalamin B12-binding domain-containing protein [Sphingomonadales bacterium]